MADSGIASEPPPNTVTKRDIIVGITTASRGIDLFGQHTFIMSINKSDSEKSVMLDASGHYGPNIRTSDVISGKLSPISIDNYLNFWDSDEILTTFTFSLSDEESEKITDMIAHIDGRSFLQCASLSSKVLSDSGVFDGIYCHSTPKGLLKNLNKYAEKNPDKVTIKYYDMKTDKEIQNE